MSELGKNTYRDYSIFDSMSTEELESILQSDSHLSDIKNSDDEVILYIMEVIAEREKDKPSGKFTDVHSAWISFNENYLPYINVNKSLYDFDEVEEPAARQKSSMLQGSYRFLRVACIIIVSLLFTGSVTAKAFGFDLWGAVAKWTKDIFFFSFSESGDIQQTTNITNSHRFEDMLHEYGIRTNLTPTWLPEGYLLKDFDVAETPTRTTFLATYKDEAETKEFLITIISLAAPSTRAYEKDEKDLAVYTVNDIEHYIISNIDKTNIVWKRETFECSIAGEFSLEEAKKMINSIYERD